MPTVPLAKGAYFQVLPAKNIQAVIQTYIFIWLVTSFKAHNRKGGTPAGGVECEMCGEIVTPTF